MKLIAKSLVLILVLLVVAIVSVVLLVDVNRFKPYIESTAKDQGIALRMGELGWALWPSLGVNATDISIAALATPDEPIAELKEAALMLALRPLFSGEFKVNHVLVEGASIHLAVDQQGKGNWEALTTNTDKTAITPPVSTPEPAADTSLNLEIERINIRNSALVYSDAKTGQTINLREINLDVTDVNTQGNPFGLTLSWLLEMVETGSADKVHVKGKLSNQVTLDKSFNNLQLTDGQVQLNLAETDIAIQYSLSVKELKNNLSYEGKMELQPLNLRQLLAALGTKLETANNNALEQFTLSSPIKGDTKQVSLDSLKLTLDKTHFTGNFAVTDFSTSAMKLVLQGDSINADDYLSTPVDAPEGVAAAPAEDTPLPLEALRELNLDATVKLASMTLKKMALESIDLRVKAHQGVIEQTLSAKAYQGDIKFASNTNAREDKAAMKFEGSMQGLELAPLLKDMEMDKDLGLSGAIEAKTQGATQGASVNQLMEAMNSTASFSGVQVRLSPLNIEEQFCKMVNLLTQQSAEEVTWDAFTELRQLDGNIVWRDQVITLESFNAGVSQLLLASTGKINLAKDRYEFKLPIKVADASQVVSLKGCSISGSNYWVDRGLSLLRCKGSFGAIDPAKDCGFDKSALKELTKDFAEYKLREKHGAKIDAAEQKIKDKKQELLNDANEKLGGEGTVKKPRDLLENLLKKKLGGKQASSASSEQSSSAVAQ